MLDGIKAVATGAITGGTFLAAATTLDGHSLMPIGAAIAILLAVAGAVWRVSSWKTRLELKIETMQSERKYDFNQAERKVFTSDTPTKEQYRATILVADDEPHDRFIARRNLEQHRFVVLEAGTLKEAREMMTNHSIDCVLLDLQLPDSNTDHTIPNFIREFPKAVCIALTGNEKPELQAQVLAQGADAFAYKADTADSNYLPRMIEKAMVHRAIKKQKRQ